LATIRGLSPYSACAHENKMAKIPSVATMRAIAGARRNVRITPRWIAAPSTAANPSASTHASQVSVPSSRCV